MRFKKNLFTVPGTLKLRLCIVFHGAQFFRKNDFIVRYCRFKNKHINNKPATITMNEINPIKNITAQQFKKLSDDQQMTLKLSIKDWILHLSTEKYCQIAPSYYRATKCRHSNNQTKCTCLYDAFSGLGNDEVDALANQVASYVIYFHKNSLEFRRKISIINISNYIIIIIIISLLSS